MTKPGHFIVLYNVFEKYQELNLMHVAPFSFMKISFRYTIYRFFIHFIIILPIQVCIRTILKVYLCLPPIV